MEQVNGLHRVPVFWAFGWVAIFFTACGHNNLSDGLGDPQQCKETASGLLQQCVSQVLAEQAGCLDDVGKPCLTRSLGTATSILSVPPAACLGSSVIRRAGFGERLTLASLQESLVTECVDSAHRLVARSLGGPHARVLEEASSEADVACLHAAYSAGQQLIDEGLAAYDACAATDPDCPGVSETDEAAWTDAAATAINASCGVGRFESLNGSSPALFAQRALQQARCTAAITPVGLTGDQLDCGPGDARMAGVEIRDATGEVVDLSLDELPRGEPFQLVLDNDIWGTSCGDGSAYAPWLRLAPEGAPMDAVLVHLEGDGACALGTCANTPARKFQSLNDNPADDLGGYMRPRSDNPFADRTLLYLPTCNQDLHIGGGGIDPGPGPNGGTIVRSGALNVRASLQLLRNLLWTHALKTLKAGYRPDQWDVLFAGTSSGAYGVKYNLHYVLDELRWRNTVASDHVAIVVGGGLVPDFDNFFALVEPTWGLTAYLPSYCHAPECATSAVMVPRQLERLLEVPRQRLLISSPQHDETQARTQGFIVGAGGATLADNRDAWINTAREIYCELRGDPAIAFFLPASSTGDIHGFVNKDEFFDRSLEATQQTMVDGIHLFDWLAAGAATVAQPLPDRVEEGSLATVRRRVQRFACSLTAEQVR